MVLNRSTLVMAKDISSRKMLFSGPVHDGFYPFHASSPAAGSQHLFAATTMASQDLWHKRLGHPSTKILNKLVFTSCISMSRTMNNTFCSDCAVSKSSKLPFVSGSCTTSKPLELLHMDVWGPAPISSVHGFRYYVIIVDDYTKYSWLYPLKFKSDVLSTFVHFKSLIENKLGVKVISIRSDFGGEFLSSKFSKFLLEQGITHQLSCPHTPKQNGCVERKHIRLVETAHTFLTVSKVPHQYWDHASSTAIYLINRMPTAINVSPWESLFKKAP
ncbi:hypothetical protein ACFX11_038955 [Malus domestica]